MCALCYIGYISAVSWLSCVQNPHSHFKGREQDSSFPTMLWEVSVPYLLLRMWKGRGDAWWAQGEGLTQSESAAEAALYWYHVDMEERTQHGSLRTHRTHRMSYLLNNILTFQMKTLNRVKLDISGRQRIKRWAINKHLCLNYLWEMYTDVYCNNKHE